MLDLLLKSMLLSKGCIRRFSGLSLYVVLSVAVDKFDLLRKGTDYFWVGVQIIFGSAKVGLPFFFCSGFRSLVDNIIIANFFCFFGCLRLVSSLSSGFDRALFYHGGALLILEFDFRTLEIVFFCVVVFRVPRKSFVCFCVGFCFSLD